MTQENNKSFRDSIEEIPQMRKDINTLVEKIEKMIAVFAQIVKQGLAAKVPDAELVKLTETVKKAITQTPCALPYSGELSAQISSEIVDEVKKDIGDAVKEKIKNTSITLDHRHSYVSSWEMTKFLEEKVRTWFLILCCFCVALFVTLSGCLIWYYHSDVYYGREYQKIYSSKYITPAEKELLDGKTYSTGFLPREYYDSPSVMRARIKRNKTLLKERASQARANKGKFSHTPAIER